MENLYSWWYIGVPMFCDHYFASEAPDEFVHRVLTGLLWAHPVCLHTVELVQCLYWQVDSRMSELCIA